MLSNAQALITKISKNEPISLSFSDHMGGATELLADEKDSFGYRLNRNLIYLKNNRALNFWVREEHQSGQEIIPSQIKWILLDVLHKTMISKGIITLPFKSSFIQTALLPSGDHLALGGEYGHLSILNLKTMTIEATQQVHTTPITKIKYEPKSNQIITAAARDKSLSFIRYDLGKKAFKTIDERHETTRTIQSKFFIPCSNSMGFTTDSAGDLWTNSFLEQKNELRKWKTSTWPDAKQDFIIKRNDSILDCHSFNPINGDYLVCVSRSKASGTNAILTIYHTYNIHHYSLNNLEDAISVRIEYKNGEMPLAVFFPNDTSIAVITSTFLHFYQYENNSIDKFINVRSIGKIDLEGSCDRAIPIKTDTGYVFWNLYDSLRHVSLYNVNQRELDSVLQALALEKNTSVKKLILKDRELDAQNIHYLHQLIKAKPDLTCELSNSAKQQCILLQSYELKNQEVMSLKLEHEKDKKLTLSQSDSLKEKFTKELEEKNHIIHQLEINNKQLESELKDTQTTVAMLKKENKEALVEKNELQEKHTIEITQMLGMLKKASATQNIPLSTQLKEAKSLTPKLLQQLLKAESLENINLIKFRDYSEIESCIEDLLEKKAIVDMNSLMIAIDVLSENPCRKKEKQLLSIVNDLIENVRIMPDYIKNEIIELMKENVLLFLLNESVKTQYTTRTKAWKESQYEADEVDFNTVIVPKKIKLTILSEATVQDNETIIENTAKNLLQYLFGSTNKNNDDNTNKFLQELKNNLEKRLHLSISQSYTTHEIPLRSFGLYPK